MKSLYKVVLLIIAGIGFYYIGIKLSPQQRDPASFRKPAKAISCKYVANDLKKTIIGYGATIHAARADASSKCFDIRTHAADMRAQSDADFYDRGLINIDECTNIRCS